DNLSPTDLWNVVEDLTSFTDQISDGTVTETVTEVEREEGEDAQPIDLSGEPRAARTLDPRLKRATETEENQPLIP
ncbi:MAG: hypothetical protein JSV38_04875, partial [Desulfobacterales bacterium]